MAATATTKPPTRLQERYAKEILPALAKKFQRENRLSLPKLSKIVLNMGVGKALQDKERMKQSAEHLALIAGQRPQITKARMAVSGFRLRGGNEIGRGALRGSRPHSPRGARMRARPQITKARMAVSGFRLREGNEIGCRVTLRGRRMYEFLDRLINVALPRIRDFRGVNPKSFDGNGNYSMGLTEQLVFPEIDPDKVTFTQGMDITFVTSTRNDDEARELLRAFGMPFREETK